ncbi:alpha-L-rhamnosidase [Mucilaginibacter sp. SP1R1]|uniref:alpha-L-rhamnosidase n=1 Tax=Mucilaginibacter sp. SP1R1 TaxID=2723091 RepID=UPI001613E541|nr:alpha-L-rhamnosidase [Mucilaginibacter sp. SP1R1]MBB6150172.1 alpha-L-rhamnosidase [Mucilaginibacter sp. SP1R1]
MINKYLIQVPLAAFMLLMVFTQSAWAQKLQVKDLTIEYAHNPMGVDVPAPRFSWKLASGLRGTMQQSYQIRVSTDDKSIGTGKSLLWDSGIIKTDESIQVAYTGPALQSKTRYYWQVQVKDNHGNSSAWSEINFWQMGILNVGEWTAKWITTFVGDTLLGPSPYFRKSFTLPKPVKSATAYITAHGLYEGQINGKKIGKDFFTPGWTSYHKRLLYQTYDVTDLLKAGGNTIGFSLGDGWYRGFMAFDGRHSFYGNQVSGLLQLEVEFTDGTKETIQTDETWKYGYGPIMLSDFYNGENYDARKAINGWSENGFNDTQWKFATTIQPGSENLVSSISPLARKHEEFKPKRILTTPKGETVIDFGQNLVGWVKFNVKGLSGTVVSIEHGEVLDKEGNFYNANLRKAKQLVTYTLKGGGIPETYEPHFTYQGFRYIKLTGYPGTPKPEDFTAIAIYSDMKPTGSFSTSNAMINQLQHNIQWGQKGNFVDIPTDCPQRDERLGWTGDAQVFSRTAAFNMDVAGFFTKWLKDVRADQLPNGSVPFVVPNVLGSGASGSTGWGDVAVIVPWNMYLAYGDKKILADQYTSMKGWVDYMTGQSKNNLWNTGFHFGDWLFYRPEDDNDGRAAITDKYLIAQAFYAHSTQLLINTAEVLGNKEDAKNYKELLGDIKKAFLKEYLTPNGRLVSGSQTAYVLALNFDMLPEDLRQQAADRLVANVKDYKYHLTTGFLGTPYLCHVLSRFGHTDIAYKLLLQDTYPSWLYPVKMGATTIWERWDGQKIDGTLQTTQMNSFNHYAYGAIGDWMYRVMVGLNTDDSGPGYKKIIISPNPGGSLTTASATLQTLYGEVTVKWTQDNNVFKMDIVVPENTSAVISLPDAATADVKESGAALGKVKTISQVAADGKDLKLNAGSGSYHFEYSR